MLVHTTATFTLLTPQQAPKNGITQQATRWSLRPFVADDMVYFGSFDNNTYALNADTGAEVWNFLHRLRAMCSRLACLCRWLSLYWKRLQQQRIRPRRFNGQPKMEHHTGCRNILCPSNRRQRHIRQLPLQQNLRSQHTDRQHPMELPNRRQRLLVPRGS